MAGVDSLVAERLVGFRLGGSGLLRFGADGRGKACRGLAGRVCWVMEGLGRVG